MLQRPPMNLLTHWTKTGRAQQTATVPWISSDFSDLGTTLGPGGFGVMPGPGLCQPWYDQWGNSFQLGVQRGGALTVGQLVTWNDPATDTVQALSTIQKVIVVGAIGAENTEIGNWLWGAVLAATASTECLKPIKANTTTSVTVSLTDPIYGNFQPDPDAYAAVTSGALTLIRPFETKVFPTAESAYGQPLGIAIGAVVQDHYYIRQTAGLGLVRTVVSPATTPHKPMIPSSATAGSAISSATIVGNEIGFAACTYNVATAALVPVFLTNRN